MVYSARLAVGAACAVVASALPSSLQARAVPATVGSTSLTFLYNNNLNLTDDANHIGAVLLSKTAASAASAACANIGETLLTKAAIQAHAEDFISLLDYQTFAYGGPSGQNYLIQDGTVHSNAGVSATNGSSLTFGAARTGAQTNPVLCTQSGIGNLPTNAVVTNNTLLTVASNGNNFVGYRNAKSFRFLGIPYANTPERFVYSTLNTATGQTYQATEYGQVCAQNYNTASGEDCLFLNIQTPYIPAAGSKKNLRPVHFYIHGGGFTGGEGSDPGTDGGQLTTREDVVVVTVNYRLSTLGFLAIPGTNITGNFGIGDQIVGLDWAIANIAAFGGDPDKITINGASAGAGSVRTLLGSPKAIGKYRAAIAMSNLGGGVTLGLSGNYGTTYSQYLTINQSYALAGQQIFDAVNCTQATLDAQIACLKTVDAQTIVTLATVARYVVQDGVIVDTPMLDVANLVNGSAHVNTIWGTVANDGASFSTYPTTPVTSLLEGLEVGLGISATYAQAVIDSGLFPYYDTGNVTLDSFNVTQRVAEDSTFRCIDQATVYAGTESGAFKTSYFYQLDRAYSGYNPNNVDAVGPVEPGFPNGDPELPYFKLHGADEPWVFGNLQVLRDANDLKSVQLTTGYFGSFVRTLQPNADPAYLAVRGYQSEIDAVAESGPWEAVSSDTGPIKKLDAVSVTAPFQDLAQCAFLNYTINYYLQ